jgi:amino acid transporter
MGALCYAELATLYPHAGGDYHFLTRAYGKNVSFLYGWAKAMVINTGSIALLAFVFGDYMSKVLPLGTNSTIYWAFLIVITLTLINLIGIHASAGIQTILTILEVCGLLAIIIAGFGILVIHFLRLITRLCSLATHNLVCWDWEWYLSYSPLGVGMSLPISRRSSKALARPS